jgi:hypothetical protein
VALRLIEVVLPAGEAEHMRDLVALEPRGGPWRQPLEDGLVCVKLLVEAEESSALVLTALAVLIVLTQR